MLKGTGLGMPLGGRDSILEGTLGRHCASGGLALEQGHPAGTAACG